MGSFLCWVLSSVRSVSCHVCSIEVVLWKEDTHINGKEMHQEYKDHLHMHQR